MVRHFQDIFFRFQDPYQLYKDLKPIFNDRFRRKKERLTGNPTNYSQPNKTTLQSQHSFFRYFKYTTRFVISLSPIFALTK